ncbi:TIGR03915 family putative DNA repair protein [Pedobacter metabolipauper]|uniref:TIGR03915 family putative DNA repair protein n=1 Tax=Pedobacter metabolipauper TaxID=425513 RepID=UPI001FB73263|nr:TIGR03915 family putative DNA repair protein [Pedobacter metabolipauper]
MIYLIDGSLEGLLCAVFEWFERKPGPVILKTVQHYQPDAFIQTFQVDNDLNKADRVWKGLQRKLDKRWIRHFYCTFLSELPEAYSSLFEFACYIFSNPPGAEANYGNAHVLALSQTAHKVEREKHRMEAFIRFEHTADGMFYCGIDPDFNVLPLIMNHFKNRYADQRWIIYDLKRHYGLYYDLHIVEEIQMKNVESPENVENIESAEHKENPQSIQIPGNLEGACSTENETTSKVWSKPAKNIRSDKESLYAMLWKDYFKSTNIVARKNTKLHIQHVPKRYWKYLTEKRQDS